MSGAFDAVLTNGLATIERAAGASGKAISDLANRFNGLGPAGERQFARIGQAISKMGGPLGEIGSKLFGAAGMEGGLGRIAAGAAIIGIAFKAFSASMEVAAARADAVMAATNRLSSAMRSAAKAREEFDRGSVDIGRTKAKAENLFGAGAGDISKSISNEFGLEQSDVLTAMAGSASIPADRRMQALRASAAAARTGMQTTAEGMSKMQDRTVLARVLSSRTPDAALMSLTQGMRVEEAANILAFRQGYSVNQLPGISQGLNLETGARITSFDSGRTRVAVYNAAARTINPEASAQAEWLSGEMRKAEELHQKARMLQAQADDRTWNIFAKVAENIQAFMAKNEANRTESSAGSAATSQGTQTP